MPTSQTGKGVAVNYYVESTINTAPGAGTSYRLRLNPSAGASLKRALINSNEVRSDGLSSMARLGSRMVDLSYSGEVSNGGFWPILEALMRSTSVAAATITFDGGAALTNLTVDSASQITFSGTTTPVAAGLRNGDVFRLANMSTAANNAVNARVKSISGSVVTLHGTPLTTQAADAACTLTIFKKLKNATTPTKRTFWLEEYQQDIDMTEQFGGVKWIEMKVSGTPDGMAMIEFKALGVAGTTATAGSAPYYTSPTIPTGIALVFADALVSINGTDVANATAFEFTYTIAAKTEPVIGSSNSPDVFDNDARLSGSVSFIRQDLTHVTGFLAETEFATHIMLVEPESEPKDAIAFFLPRCKRTAVDGSLGGDGAYIETVPFTCGKSESVTGVDDTLLTISESAA